MGSKTGLISVERLFAMGGKVEPALRSQNWSQSLGAPDSWPQSLCTSLGLCFGSPLPGAVLWGDRHYLIANHGFYRLLGLPVSSRTVGIPLQTVHPPLWDRLHRFLLQVKQMGQAVEVGDLGWTDPILQLQGYRCGLSPILDDVDGIEGVLVTLFWPPETTVPSSGRQGHQALLPQGEAYLSLANERFQLAAMAINALIYDWNIFTNTVERTEGLTRILGYTLEEAEPTMEWWRDRIHPDDLPRAEQRFREAIAQTDRFSNEYRVLNKANRYIDVMDCGIVASRDAHGQPTRIVGSTTDISAAKQAQAEMRRSEERYRAIVENAPDAILITNIDGRVVEVNPNTCALLSYSEAELIGRSISDFMIPDDLPRLKTALAHLKAGDTSVEQWTLVNREGTGIPVEVSHKRLPDGRWQSFVRDIRDRKIAEAKLRSFAEANVIGILFGDIYGTIHSANDEFLRIVGYSREDLQAGRLNWRSLTPPEFLSLDQARVAEAQEKGACTPYEKEYIRQDGSHVPVLLGYSVLEPEREETVAFILDLSEQKRVEAERSRLLQREKAAREEAERANRIKDEFLTVLSHELRSPLNPILGWASLLRKQEVNGPILKQALETIERNSKLQLRLIDDLLDISRILRGKLKLERDMVNLATVITAATETVCLSAEAKGIQIEMQIEGEVDPVLGDEGRLQQIVWNLLSNAVKFTPHGGQVQVFLQQVGAQAHLKVGDTGKGISPDFLPRVFDHFQQEDGSITRKFGGLGLGLAIVRYLTEMHGGQVRVESPGEGLGATFTVVLPVLSPVQQAEMQDSKKQDALLRLPSLQNLQVLLVEDEPDSRNFIRFALEQMGVQVTAVTSSREAILAWRQSIPQVLISDIGMPDLDGYGLIQYVRSLPPNQGGQVPAIALTAYAGEGDAHKALQAGFQCHLPKPIVLQHLYQTLATFVPSDDAPQCCTPSE